MWHTGLAAPQHGGSSRTRDRTRVPCIGRQILNHCATREVQLVSEVLQAVVEDKQFYSSSPIFEIFQEKHLCGYVIGVKCCEMKKAPRPASPSYSASIMHLQYQHKPSIQTPTSLPPSRLSYITEDYTI